MVWLVWRVAIAVARIWLLGRVTVARLLRRIAIAVTRLEALGLVVVAGSLSAHGGGGGKLWPEGRGRQHEGVEERSKMGMISEDRGTDRACIREFTSSSKFPHPQLHSSHW